MLTLFELFGAVFLFIGVGMLSSKRELND